MDVPGALGVVQVRRIDLEVGTAAAQADREGLPQRPAEACAAAGKLALARRRAEQLVSDGGLAVIGTDQLMDLVGVLTRLGRQGVVLHAEALPQLPLGIG